MELVEKISMKLKERGLKMVTAESCTGGMVAAAMTDRAGSSDVFECGFVTYSNDSKMELLGVPAATIEKYGAVSAQTAEAMVKGALEHSRAHIAVAVTGIAGPSGGTTEKPVGLVYVGYGSRDKVHMKEHRFSGDRANVRRQAVEKALRHLLEFIA